MQQSSSQLSPEALLNPQNRAQRRRAAKAFRGFKGGDRSVWRTMNKHMKIKQAARAAAHQKEDSDGQRVGA